MHEESPCWGVVTPPFRPRHFTHTSSPTESCFDDGTYHDRGRGAGQLLEQGWCLICARVGMCGCQYQLISIFFLNRTGAAGASGVDFARGGSGRARAPHAQERHVWLSGKLVGWVIKRLDGRWVGCSAFCKLDSMINRFDVIGIGMRLTIHPLNDHAFLPTQGCSSWRRKAV